MDLICKVAKAEKVDAVWPGTWEIPCRNVGFLGVFGWGLMGSKPQNMWINALPLLSFAEDSRGGVFLCANLLTF